MASSVNVLCAYTELKPIHKLVPHPENPHVHSPEQIDRLAKLIDYQGIRHPVIVSKRSGFIVAGHGRLMALKKLNVEQVPIDYQDFADEAQEYEFIVSDNAIGKDEWAALDVEIIKKKIDILPIKIPMLGLKDFDIKKLEPQSDEDEVPETPVEPVSKLGDLYEIGNHRLLCGDSTDVVQVEKLMNGEKADMVFTDPPYGIDLDTDWSSLQNKDYAKKISKNTTYISDTKKHSKIINDDTILNLGFIFSENYKQIIIFGGNYFAQDIPKEVYSKGSFLVWDKNGGNEDFNKMFGSSFELAFLYPAKKQDIIYRTWRGAFGRGDGSGFLRGKTNALETDKTVHPTQKPVRLWLQIIEQIKLEEGSVFDPFGGSGSTLIACEKTNRKCFMMELDPHYIDVIVSRWCKYTGQTKIKRNGEEVTWNG